MISSLVSHRRTALVHFCQMPVTQTADGEAG